MENVLTLTVDTPVGVPRSVEDTLISIGASWSEGAGNIVKLAVGAPLLHCLLPCKNRLLGVHVYSLLPCGQHQRLEVGLGEGGALRGLAASQVIKVLSRITSLIVTLIPWIFQRLGEFRNDDEVLPSVPSRPHHP